MSRSPRRLADAAWPELVDCRWLLVVPLGSTEQHGPHLPFATDTLVATELATRLVADRSDGLLAPAVPYGASGEHRGFPGSLSLGTAALTAALVELARSADGTADRVLFVNGHGGNLEALDAAVSLLRNESRDVRGWSPQLPGDAHAGHTETSLLLALAGDSVRRSAVAAGATDPLPELLPILRTAGVAAVSANGVLGDPSAATAEAGEELLALALADLHAAVAAWWP